MCHPNVVYYARAELPSIMPNLETLLISSDPEVPQQDLKHESVFEGSSNLRQLPEHRHDCLKIVEITGFSYAKSLIELTCYIVKNAVSLECLTLDTVRCGLRCPGEANETCWPIISNAELKEASRTVMAIRMYIENKVVPKAKLTVLEPCIRCRSNE
ncbi:hypothetical protein ABZP36_018901 [Zizania latifolia]